MSNPTYNYKAFGLKIRSEIFLPELVNIQESIDIPNLHIKFEDLSSLWDHSSESGRVTAIKDDLLMFRVPDLAIFGVKGGRYIKISPLSMVDDGELRLFVLGTCMGIVLMQRKTLPLHGSAVAIDGHVFAFVGEQGAGKSTLAHAFLKRGGQLITDDVIAISHIEDKPYVIPAYPQQKLWEESLQAFGEKTEGYKSLFSRESKYAIPIESNYCESPLPISRIYELIPGDTNKVILSAIEGLYRFLTLHRHTYRNFLISRLNLKEWHFNQTAKILSSIPCLQIQRPTDYFSADEIVSLILNSLELEAAP